MAHLPGLLACTDILGGLHRRSVYARRAIVALHAIGRLALCALVNNMRPGMWA